MKKLTILLILVSNTWNLCAQGDIGNSNRVKRQYFRDSIVSIEKWYGNDKKLDSLKTYYKSGELNELFYYDKAYYQGKSYKFNRFGEKLTTWEFNKGTLISRTDHKIEFTIKTEEKVKKAHSRLKELNLALKEKPNDFKSIFQRASIRNYLGNSTLALNDYKKIERLILKISKTKEVPDKMLGNIYDHLANIYQGYEMNDYCIHYKLKALKASPTESRLYHNLGSYLVSIKSYRLGLVYLNKAIEMIPNHSFAHWISAVAYTELEDYNKAMTHVNIAFKNEASLYKRGTGRSEIDLRTIRGFLYHKLGDSNKGIADLEGALNIDNNNSFAYRNLGVIYNDLGNYNKACELLKKAKDLGYEKIHDKYDLQEYLDFSCKQLIAQENQTTAEIKPVRLPKLLDKPFIYPNPTKGEINIKNLSFKDYKYLIFDYSGKLVNQGNSKSNPINISQLPSGIYVLRVVKNNLSETFRVVKE